MLFDTHYNIDVSGDGIGETGEPGKMVSKEMVLARLNVALQLH